jgi:hypothetical protein
MIGMIRRVRGSRPELAGELVSGQGEGTSAGVHPWVIHPFLIASFPVVSLFGHNVYEVTPRAIALPMALAVGSTFVAWLVLRFLLRDAAKAGLAASILVASFFGFKSFDESFVEFWIGLTKFWIYDPNRPNPLVSVAILAVLDAAAVGLIAWRGGRAVRWTFTLNVFALVLVGIPALGAISARLKEPAALAREAAVSVAPGQGSRPDIYFIILDGFARSDVMKELYDFDYSPVLDRLERRGFFVGRRSFSNYCQTRLSLASTLNLCYLDKLISPGSADLLPLTEAIHGNLVRRTLRPLGYKFVSFATDFDPTEIPDADVFLKPAVLRPGFGQLLFEMTPLAAWRSEVGGNDSFKTLRDRTLFVLDRLPEVATNREPTFTFAHLMAPHPPFVFGEHGEDVSPRRILEDGSYFDNRKAFRSPEYVRTSYRNEAAFMIGRIERVIDQILANSPEPPVIVLQSDHGAFLRYHPEDLEATDLRERFGILNCIYGAGRKIEGLSDGMTSVNTFRAILRDVVGANLPPLEERSYFSTLQQPLDFVDVTDRLHSEAELSRTYQYPKLYLGVDPQL